MPSTRSIRWAETRRGHGSLRVRRRRATRLGALLAAASRERFFLGLIDAANCFEPKDWPEEELGRLLWVMGGGAETTLKAVDFLLRDGNLPLLLLDFQVVPARQLQKVPISTWHRFHRVAAQSAVALVVVNEEANQCFWSRSTPRRPGVGSRSG